jgi:glutaryl-CoA dehydrogenase
MTDFLQFDACFSEEERLIQASVKRWVESRFLNTIQDAFETNAFLPQWSEEIAALGLLGMTLPIEVGGAGASYMSYGLACQELERGDSAIRSFMSVQSSLCMYPIFAFGTPWQHQKFLPDMALGKKLGCFGLTEPDAGSDPASMKTTAKKVQGGYLLNGSKLWITNATVADVAIVWAKNEVGEVRGFLVEKDFEGFQSHEIKHKLSLKASVTGGLYFKDCFVPDSHFLPGSEKGLVAPLSCLSKARYGIAWGATGAAMACYEAALNYTKERKQFNRPLASFQLVQKDLVDMLTDITLMQAYHYRLGQLMDQDAASYVMISMAKMNACKRALQIARQARNLLGANGISLEYPVIRHMNNLESVFTYEGTDNMHHLIIGRAITGLSAFS